MKQQIFREITPLAQNKLFFAKFTPGDPMDFPLHFHDDYELTLVLNVRGKRIVGNLIEDFSDRDLVLIGSDEIHGYKWAPEYAGGDVAVIQFSRYAKDYQMFTKDILEPIGAMLANAKVGIKFSDSTTRQLQDDILRLPKMTGIDGVLLFLKILHDLAVSPGQTILSAVPIISDSASYRKDCDRIDTIIHFIESNYRRKISLEEIGRTVNMSASYVCRFFKRKTGNNLWDYLNNYRVDSVAHEILRKDGYISEICYSCGFSNLATFNRAFKKRMGITPNSYRAQMKDLL